MFLRSCAAFSFVLSIAPFVSAQSTAKPLTQEELLRQIESVAPNASDPGRRTPALMPIPGAAARAPKETPGPTAAQLFPETTAPKPDKPEKKAKGPTEIVALEASFDQKTHVAIFIGQVVVTDPEFNVQCDKLTAYLKHNDQPAGDAPAGGARLKTAPATPEPKKDGDKPDKGGGLEKALAEADPGGIVTVMQEKLEADGSTSRSIGHGRKVNYDSVTGDITLYGKPDVQQGINTCVATEDGTIMILNRDGKMRVTGAHKTVIRDQGGLEKK